MNRSLEYKLALVIGGNRSIGAAIVTRLARKETDIAMISVRQTDRTDATVKAAQPLQVKSVSYPSRQP